MTNKEAIKMLKSKMDGHTDTSYEWAETVRMAIKALEQQLCDDCISRQAVLDALVGHKYSREFCEEHHIDWSINLNTALITINDLSSVTPKEKTGHWIDRSGGDPTDSNVSCNLCNKWFHQSTNFCPNCGAKMVEPQESEVNNG